MPARFVFELQALLDARERVEKQKRGAAAACGRAVEQCGAELERLTGLRRRCESALAAAAGGGGTRDARFYDAHLQLLGSNFARRQLRREELAALCERAREELAAARRDASVIENLKARRRRRFELGQARRDEHEIDEANAAATRKGHRVIALTRPNGQPVMLNCDLIESIEQNGETIVLLTTGNAVVVREPMDEIERRVVAFKRKIYSAKDSAE